MALTKREKFVLTILKEISKPISKIKFVKLMFLASDNLLKKGNDPPYSFIPYKFGPFSFQLYNDLNRLEKKELICQDEKKIKIMKDIEFNIKNEDFVLLKNIVREFGDYNENKILKFVYSKYPQFKKYQELTENEYFQQTEPILISIGYEGLSIDDFLCQLVTNEIKKVIDVRNNPFSMKYGFSKRALTEILGNFKIEYHHFPKLGILSEFRKNLETYEDYQRLFVKYENELENNTEDLEKLKKLCENNRVAIMCFEHDPNFCHRTIIIRKLQKWGMKVSDIDLGKKEGTCCSENVS